MSIFGWDISTSVVGVTILDDNGKWIKTDHFDYSKIDAKSLHDKMDESQWWVEEILEPYTTGHNTHYFEDRLQNFAFGKTRLQTLMMLAAFNSLFSYEVWRIHKALCTYEKSTGVSAIHIHPSTVKAIMKKHGLIIPKGSKEKKMLTLQFVKGKQPDFQIDLNKNDKPKPYMFDRADSYIVAKAGFWRNYLSKNEPREEVTSNKTNTGSRTDTQRQ